MLDDVAAELRRIIGQSANDILLPDFEIASVGF